MDWNLPLPPQLNGRNFRIWAGKIRIFFKCIKLWHLLQDEEKDGFHVEAFQL